MSEIKKANISFEKFVVRESNIIFNEIGSYDINLKFEPHGFVLKSLNQFHLGLDIEIQEAKEKIHISIKTVSTFIYTETDNLEEYLNTLFILNAPAIVFPYIRSYISTLTAVSGLPTLTLPTLNLTSIGEDLKRNIVIEE